MSTYSCDQCDPHAIQQYLNNETPCRHCGSDLTEITPSLPGDFEVHTDTICDGWLNCWHIGDANTEEPQRFDTVLEAQAEIDEHIADLAQMRRDEGETFDGVDAQHERDQLRIYQISTGTYVDDDAADNEEFEIANDPAYLQPLQSEPTQQILFIHGRHQPDEKPDDWGFDGTTIKGISALHATYGNFVVHFTSMEAAITAQALTGWDWFDANALEMRWHEDLIHTREGYFADFEMQPETPLKPSGIKPESTIRRREEK